MIPALKFDGEDLVAAHRAWKCSCGPSALAALAELDLPAVREVVGKGFESRGYMSPTQMEIAAARAGLRMIPRPVYGQQRCPGQRGLAWVQFQGRWLRPGVPPHVAYLHTHWIAYWMDARGGPFVFDCNAGIAPVAEWWRETVPALVQEHRGATGVTLRKMWRVEPMERRL